MCGSYPFFSAGLQRQKLVWWLQRIPSTLRSVFLNSSFRSIPCIKIIQGWTLNAFHGQALATALKSNGTVVDINLAGNRQCGNEGAEACEPIWDELTAGGFDLPDTDWHWQTLTVSHFFELEWMDVVSATFSLCGWHFFCRQWRRSSARTLPSSVWTWSIVESMMLGWRPGGRILLQWRAPAMKDPRVGPKIAWSGNAADYVWVWLWRCWGGFLWQVIVFESLAFTMPGALRKARRQVLFVDCRLLQAYNATHLMREDMRHFVYETVIGAAFRA